MSIKEWLVQAHLHLFTRCCLHICEIQGKYELIAIQGQSRSLNL